MNLKKVFFSLLALGSMMQLKAQAFDQIQIGDPLPLKGHFFEKTMGSKTTLENLKKDKGIILVFTSNKCPFVTEWEGDYANFYAQATDQQIAFVLVNSNEKFRAAHESKKHTIENAKSKGYEFVPQIIDRGSKLANAMGANTTPHVFFFDKNLKLIYKGALDDRFENKKQKVTQQYLNKAIEQYIADKTVAKSETRNIGCSIKRQVK